MNWKYIGLGIFCMSCRDNKSSLVDDTGDWWDVEDGEENTPSTEDENDESKPDEEKPDTEKPDEGEPGTLMSGFMDFGTLEGVYTIEHQTEDDSGCTINYTFSAIEVTDCSMCSFAYELLLGVQEIQVDNGACDDLEDLTNRSLLYGQSTTMISEYQGVIYYELLEHNEGWNSDPIGYSAELTEETWIFGSK